VNTLTAFVVTYATGAVLVALAFRKGWLGCAPDTFGLKLMYVATWPVTVWQWIYTLIAVEIKHRRGGRS
jgi:hypothetical protein